jgi:hypothetical protein
VVPSTNILMTIGEVREGSAVALFFAFVVGSVESVNIPSTWG